MAKDSVTLDQLPKASLLEESDFVPALKRGAAAGGGVGLLAGLAAVTFPPAGIALGGGALLGLLLVEAEGKHPERIRQTVLKYHPSASFESTQDTVTPVV